MDAVIFALATAVLFGAQTVALRLGLRHTSDVTRAGVANTLVALAVVTPFVAIRGVEGLSAGVLAAYAIGGALAPAGSQLCFIRGVRDAGPARASIVIGTAPLVAVAIAVAVLREPLHPMVLLGGVLVVAGGTALVGERTKPGRLMTLGLVFAFASAVLFATRDNLVRATSERTTASPGQAAAVSLLAAVIVMFAFLLVTNGRQALAIHALPFRAFTVSGLFSGLSYVTLFEAYERGRVTVVSPLVATEALWGVLFSALLFYRGELINRRLLLSAALVTAGSALVGAFR